MLIQTQVQLSTESKMPVKIPPIAALHSRLDNFKMQVKLLRCP
jgi:hypothetical protein